MNSSPRAKQWRIEESSISGTQSWTILVHAARSASDAALGFGWVAMHDPTLPVLTVTFDRPSATTWLRILYSAFAALHDPEDYLTQIGLGWANVGSKAPHSAIIGVAKGLGSMQVLANWESDPRLANILIYPVDGPKAEVSFGLESVAHVTQVTIEAFKLLDWPIPD